MDEIFYSYRYLQLNACINFGDDDRFRDFGVAMRQILGSAINAPSTLALLCMCDSQR